MKRSLYHLGELNWEDWRDIPDFVLGPWWLGNFAPGLNTSNYGSNDFHGRFHPAIPWVAIKRYSKPGGVVWDCFAGSGTTLDVGNELGRDVIASDMHPSRPDIIRMDCAVEVPDIDVDLGIMHPPYMGIIDYDCPMSNTNNVQDFVGEFDACFNSMDTVLCPGHVLVLVIGEIWLHGNLVPLEYELNNLIRGVYNYRLFGRIVKDFGTYTKGGTVTNTRHGNLWKVRLLRFGYFRNGIDTILFYQKPI